PGGVPLGPGSMDRVGVGVGRAVGVGRTVGRGAGAGDRAGRAGVGVGGELAPGVGPGGAVAGSSVAAGPVGERLADASTAPGVSVSTPVLGLADSTGVAVAVGSGVR